MFRDTDWPEFEETLHECAPGLARHQCDYLRDAFIRTEEMWHENTDVKNVLLVMLSEAPLFGARASYFYNRDSGFTSFFQFNDAEAILGGEIANRRSDKRFLLPKLAEAGFIILDVFPFAFNEKDTGSITYRSRSLKPHYRQLFERTARLFFNRKRDLILEHGNPQFVFRYETMQKTLGVLVNSDLAKRGIGPAESIGSKNYWLDREKLKRAWENARRTAVT